jgi:hypothetical protein
VTIGKVSITRSAAQTASEGTLEGLLEIELHTDVTLCQRELRQTHVNITSVDETFYKEYENQDPCRYPDNIPENRPQIRVSLDIWLGGIGVSVGWQIIGCNCRGDIFGCLRVVNALSLGREQRLTLWIICRHRHGSLAQRVC